MKTYDDIRGQIKNGDLIHLYRADKPLPRTVLHWVINFFTGSPIYHNVIALWMSTDSGERRLMCVESHIKGGKRIVPLSVYADEKMEIHPLPDDVDFTDMEPTLMHRVGRQRYGIFDFIAIGLREFTGIKLGDAGGQVCSEMAAEAWISAGVHLPGTLLSPGRLRGELIKLGITPTIRANMV
jgi:hypothetical protein